MDQKEESINCVEQCEELKLYMRQHPECHQLLILPPPTTLYEGENFWDFLDSEGKPTGYKVSLSGKVLGKRGKLMTSTPHVSGYIRISFKIKNERIDYYAHVIISDTFLYNDDPINKNQKDHKNMLRSDNRVCNLRHVTPSENALNRSPGTTFKAVLQLGYFGLILNRWDSMVSAARENSSTVNKIKTACEKWEFLDGKFFVFEDVESHKVLNNEYKSYQSNSQSIPIIQMNLGGIPIKIWRCIKDATIGVNGKGHSTIKNQILGKRFDAYGYKWREATEYEIEQFLPKIPPESFEYGQWFALKQIIGYILVSTMGFIITDKNSIHLGCLNSSGYYTTRFNGISIGVNRLVLMAFCPIDDAENYISDHINMIKSDNRLVNLRWLTQQQNIVLAVGKPVIAYDLNGSFYRRFESMRETAKVFNTSESTIGRYIDSDKSYLDYYLRSELKQLNQ